MSVYRATVLNIVQDRSGYYGSVVRSLIHALNISDITRIDNVTIRSPSIDERFVTDTANDFIRRSTAQAIILYCTKLYQGKPDRRLVVIEFTDFPILMTSVYRAPECVRFMAMQRWDKAYHCGEPCAFPASEYPRLDAGFFSTNDNISPLSSYTGEINQLFFGGTFHLNAPQREVIPFLESHPDVRFVLSTMQVDTKERDRGWHRSSHNHPYDYSNYLTLAGQHLAMLALEGTSGFCFREFDALRMGAPLIMSPWRFSHRMEPLIDGEHYWAAEYDSNVEIFAERILRRFNEIRYDSEKRERIRLNGQQWFYRNCTIPHITANIVRWVETAFATTHPLT